MTQITEELLTDKNRDNFLGWYKKEEENDNLLPLVNELFAAPTRLTIGVLLEYYQQTETRIDILKRGDGVNVAVVDGKIYNFAEDIVDAYHLAFLKANHDENLKIEG